VINLQSLPVSPNPKVSFLNNVPYFPKKQGKRPRSIDSWNVRSMPYARKSAGWCPAIADLSPKKNASRGETPFPQKMIKSVK